MMKMIRISALAATAFMLASCGQRDQTSNEAPVADMPAAQQESQPMNSSTGVSEEIVPGLTMTIIEAGSGDVARTGQIASVHYTGWLHDPSAPGGRGEKFDSSLDRDEHFAFPLGAGRVIRGWDQGVVGMRVGEKRELVIAPELAYGQRQVGDLIPPGSTLVFEVELAGVSGGEPAAQ